MSKHIKFICLILLLFGVQCNPNNENDVAHSEPQIKASNTSSFINPSGVSIVTRFYVPEGYNRIEVGRNSYASYIRNLPLKNHGSVVYYYDGKIKGRNVHEAVIDMEIGKQNLQQCADAAIRLRAEYLFQQKRYEEIQFQLTNGFWCDYSHWRKGNRLKVLNNKASWSEGGIPSDSYSSFRSYLDVVFTYAGTLSLAQTMERSSVKEMKIGDIFLQGGAPGHAVIICDMAENAKGEKLFMLAQSYMPAQEIHVLKNYNQPDISPWYRADFGEFLLTPEWKFSSNDVRTWVKVAD